MMKFLVAAVITAIAASAHAQTVPMTPELQKIIEGARQEGRLVVSMTPQIFNGAEGTKHAEEMISKMFGVNIQISWSAGPFYAAVAGKMLAELQAKQPSSNDVFHGTAVQVAPFAKTGLWKQVDWVKLMPSRITPEMIEANGGAIRDLTNYPAIVYNKARGAQATQLESLDDLLKPEWKNKFYSNPILAGFDVIVSDEKWGEKKTEEYVRKMAKQVAGLIDCGSSDRIASGEVPVFVIDCGGNDAFAPKHKDVNGTKILKDFAQKRYGYFAIPQNSPHPNAATLFTLYWLTEEGQEYVWNTTGSELADFPTSHRRDEIAALEKQGFKFTEVTVNWWDAQKGITEAHRRIMQVLQREGGR